MTTMNQQWHLVSRPSGEPTRRQLPLVEAPVPELQDGQVLVRNHYLSLDPYMRGRMNDGKSYAAAAAAGRGDGRRHRRRGGRVEEPGLRGRRQGGRHGRLAAVPGGRRAAQRGVLRKVDTTHVPLSAYLGAVGMPGVTAWYGLMTDHRAQGRRDRGGQRRQRRGGQRGRASWPRRAAAARWAWPAGADKCALRGRRTRLRRLHRLQGSTPT